MTMRSEKPRLVGSSGKAQVIPTKKQAGWTGSKVEPVIVRCPAPVDYRYCVDPASFEGGEFVRAGIGRYVA